MQPPRPGRPNATPLIVVLAAVAVVAAACAGGTSGPGGNPTVPGVDQLSLPPAQVTTEPVPVESPGAPPSVGTPEGTAPAPPEVTVDYTGPADDLAGFIAAYRETFGADIPDDEIGAAGARLCTYLQRHAGADGTVPIGTAIGEADLNEPGYPRDVWVAAYELVTTYYCTELIVVGGDQVTP